MPSWRTPGGATIIYEAVDVECPVCAAMVGYGCTYVIWGQPSPYNRSPIVKRMIARAGLPTTRPHSARESAAWRVSKIREYHRQVLMLQEFCQRFGDLFAKEG